MRLFTYKIAIVQFAFHEVQELNKTFVEGHELLLRSHVPVVLRFASDPESGVAGDAVDMLLDRRRAHEPVERVFHQEAIAEDVVDGAPAHLEVAHPAATVTLRRVPDVVLHAEMRCVRADGPHQVQLRIGRLEEALVFDRVVDEIIVDGFEPKFFTANEADDGITKSTLGCKRGAVCWDEQRVLSEIRVASVPLLLIPHIAR